MGEGRAVMRRGPLAMGEDEDTGFENFLDMSIRHRHGLFKVLQGPYLPAQKNALRMDYVYIA